MTFLLRSFSDDQYSSKVLTEVRWQDYSLVPKAVELGIAVH